MGQTDTVLDGQPRRISCSQHRVDVACKRILSRRIDLQFVTELLAETVVQLNHRLIRRSHGIAETPVLPGQHEHVAKPGVESAAAVSTCLICHDIIEFSIIVDAEADGSALHRGSVIHHLHGSTTRRYIIPHHIDLSIARRPLDHILRAVVVTVHFGVQDHRPRHRAVEPCPVQHRLRLACAHEVPVAVYPHLNPRVVVVGMSPPRGIDLPGRDSRRTQSSHCQHRLLAAAPQAPLHYRLRASGTPVGRLVSSLLMAPMIDFESSLGQRHAGHTLAELVGILGAEIVQSLVVHPQRQHEMAELTFRDAPAHAVTHLQRLGDIGLPVIPAVLQTVRQRHVFIQPVGIALYGIVARSQGKHCGHDCNYLE